MAKSGKPPVGIFDNAIDCAHALPADSKYTGYIYCVEILGHVKFLWATSEKNAMRRLWRKSQGKATKISTAVCIWAGQQSTSCNA